MLTQAQMGSLVGRKLFPEHASDMMISTVGDFFVPLQSGFVEVFDKEADFQPAFTIGFAQGEELSGLPVLPSLRSMVDATADAVLRLSYAFAGQPLG